MTISPTSDAVTLPVADLRQRGENPVVATGPGGQPELVGTRCASCGALAVPDRFVCAVCASRDVTRTSAGSTGTLYSFSTVHVSSSRETPYTLGYVDLDSGPRVLATIAGDPDELSPDVPVVLVRPDEHTWAFALANREDVFT